MNDSDYDGEDLFDPDQASINTHLLCDFKNLETTHWAVHKVAQLLVTLSGLEHITDFCTPANRDLLNSYEEAYAKLNVRAPRVKESWFNKQWTELQRRFSTVQQSAREQLVTSHAGSSTSLDATSATTLLPSPKAKLKDFVGG